MGDRGIGPHEAGRDGPSREAWTSGSDGESSAARWDDDGGHGREPVTEPPPETSTSPPGGLFLRGVLDSALPHSLGTDDAPERYTVSAVFSRHVMPEERTLIEAPAAVAALTARGWSGVHLKVADRRLEIGGTNLTQLEDGLAAAVAALLRDVEEEVLAARERRDDERVRWGEVETARAARVKAMADRVRFE